MQGVIKAYDPDSKLGVVMCDTDLADYDLAANALEGSIFRMLRQGQRVVFDLDQAGRATRLRLGSEVDMGTPGLTELAQTLSALVRADYLFFRSSHLHKLARQKRSDPRQSGTHPSHW